MPGSEPLAQDGNIQGGAKKQDGGHLDWNSPRAAEPRRDKRAGPREWSIRGKAGQSPGLEQPGMQANGHSLDRPRRNKKEKREAAINM